MTTVFTITPRVPFWRLEFVTEKYIYFFLFDKSRFFNEINFFSSFFIFNLRSQRDGFRTNTVPYWKFLFFTHLFFYEYVTQSIVCTIFIFDKSRFLNIHFLLFFFFFIFDSRLPWAGFSAIMISNMLLIIVLLMQQRITLIIITYLFKQFIYNFASYRQLLPLHTSSCTCSSRRQYFLFASTN